MLWSGRFCPVIYQDFTQEGHLIIGGGGGSGFREELIHSGVGCNFLPTAEQILNFCSGVDDSMVKMAKFMIKMLLF